MNFSKKVFAAICSALVLLGCATATSTALADEPTPFTRCDFYYQGQCYDHWIATPDSCMDISSYGDTWQILACEALYGIGSRG